jgi:hypothetical protein
VSQRRRITATLCAALIPVALMALPARADSSATVALLPQTKLTLYEHWSHFRDLDGPVTTQRTLHVSGRSGPVVGTEFTYCADDFCQTNVTMFSPEFGVGTFITLGCFCGSNSTRLSVVDGTGDFAGVRGHVWDTYLGGHLERLGFDLWFRT